MTSRSNKFTPRGLLAVVIVGSLSCGCQAMRSAFRGQDAGVPLTDFAAADGQYFPPFVLRFFPGAGAFTSDRPTLGHAREDLVMIEIKPLNAQGAPFNEANLSWSADGVYLGFEVITDGFRKIMLKDLAGDYARELEMIPKGAGDFLDGMVIKSAQSYNAGLRWSRDSTRYAFMSNGGVGEYNIYVGAVGAPEKPVASSPTKDGYATWSPKTSEIAFVSGRSGGGDIYVVDLGSKAVERLSYAELVDIFPDWFPSGEALVYSSGDALDHDLHVVERDRASGKWQRPRPLTAWPRDDLRPTVSPDGRFVAFYSDSGDTEALSRSWNIHVVPYLPGKTYDEQELAGTVVARDVVIDLNTGPAWSPDSRKLLYVKRDPTVFNPIYGYDLFTGRSYLFKTDTRMNRDILMSKLGILSFRAQVGVWDRVFVALTNQGLQIQDETRLQSKIHYLK